MGHKGGLITPAPGADNTEPVFQIPVGHPNLERGRRVEKMAILIYRSKRRAEYKYKKVPCRWK